MTAFEEGCTIGGGSNLELYALLDHKAERQPKFFPFTSELFVFIGILEALGECFPSGEHYMAGGRPGVYPSLTEPNDQMRACGLYPPHGFNVDLLPFRASLAKQDEAKRARGRQVEINNGRLAMLGIFSLISEQKVPGAVPFLSGKIPTLPDMEIMGPFVGTDGISHIW